MQIAILFPEVLKAQLEYVYKDNINTYDNTLKSLSL